MNYFSVYCDKRCNVVYKSKVYLRKLLISLSVYNCMLSSTLAISTQTSANLFQGRFNCRILDKCSVQSVHCMLTAFT